MQQNPFPKASQWHVAWICPKNPRWPETFSAPETTLLVAVDSMGPRHETRWVPWLVFSFLTLRSHQTPTILLIESILPAREPFLAQR